MILRLIAFVWPMAFGAAALAADAAMPPADTALPASHADAIASALKALPKRRDLDPETRKQVEESLHQAQDDEAHADQLAQQWQSLNQTAAGADAETQKIEDALARNGGAAAWRAALPEHATNEQLESLLARERDGLTDARAAVASLQNELARQTLRPAELRDELTQAHAALDALANSTAPAGAANAAAEAKRLREAAAQRLANMQIALLNLENRSYEPRMRLLSAQLRERQRALAERGEHVSTLESLLLDRTGSTVAELQARVARERDDAGTRSRLLSEAATANVDLADKLADAVHDLGQLRTQRQEWDKALRNTTAALKNTEERIRIGGVNEAVGLILLAERSRLKPVPLLRRELAELQTDYAQARLGLLELREQQDALADPAHATDAALAQLQDVPPERLEALRAQLNRLFATRAEILAQSGVQLTRLAGTQAEAEPQLRTLLETTEKFSHLLDSHLLWMPSHKPIDSEWFGRFWNDSRSLFAAPRWLRALDGVRGVVLRAPLLSGAALVALIALFLLAWRAPARLEAIAAPMRRIRSDRYRLTGSALLWTLLAAAAPALAFWLLGLAFAHVAPPGNAFATELGVVFESLVPTVFVFAFVRALTGDKGLAHAHFRWPRPRREALHAAAPALALLIVPTQFLIELAMLRGSQAPIDALGRLLLVLALLAAAVFAWYLLAPGRVWTLRDVVLREPLRLRQSVRVGLSGAAIVLALLVLRGYFVTALTLSERALQTFAVLLAASLLYGLAARWLVLGERRLALKRMQEKLASESISADESGAEPLHEPEPEEITLASINAQTRRLLRTVILLALAAVLLWIWSDVAPALTLLGDAQVWSSSDTIDGKVIALKVSLRDVLDALVVFALTLAATRNLPGLFEVGVLRRFNVDAATRYAITSVTRYLIVFTGVLVGMSMLGLHWSNLQWLAAGFSVGLGFGLQEIFANFASGLMVLFERPFRIGDIITIGNVEGTVTRIRTRATTIVDWDNREVIVPNKSFITDRLVNWTLSDSTTRVVIKVGIAYRNDPKLAQKLLLDIAAAHPQVLAEPAPTCWMTGFSNSTQDLELRVYVADIGQRNPVRTELQFRIAEVFREHDIEIAFPQMDLWIRNDGGNRAAAGQPAPSAEATSASNRA